MFDPIALMELLISDSHTHTQRELMMKRCIFMPTVILKRSTTQRSSADYRLVSRSEPCYFLSRETRKRCAQCFLESICLFR